MNSAEPTNKLGLIPGPKAKVEIIVHE